MRRSVGIVLALLMCAPARAAAEPPTKEACVAAYRSSQPLSRSGELTKARAALLVCARDPCPAVLQEDCVTWLDDVAQRMPTIIVVLRDPSGEDLPSARVLVDGAEVSTRIDGRQIEIDPGEHVVRVELVDAEPMERHIVAREREKGRDVVFDLAPKKRVEPTPPPAVVAVVPPPAQEPPRDLVPERRALPWTFWATTGVSAVALTVFGVLGVRGLQMRGDLEPCSPSCAPSRVDSARTDFLVADVSLAVGVIAAGVATVLYVTRPSSRSR